MLNFRSEWHFILVKSFLWSCWKRFMAMLPVQDWSRTTEQCTGSLHVEFEEFDFVLTEWMISKRWCFSLAVICLLVNRTNEKVAHGNVLRAMLCFRFLDFSLLCTVSLNLSEDLPTVRFSQVEIRSVCSICLSGHGLVTISSVVWWEPWVIVFFSSWCLLNEIPWVKEPNQASWPKITIPCRQPQKHPF